MDRRPRAVMLSEKEADMLRTVVDRLAPDEEIVTVLACSPEDQDTILRDMLNAVEAVYHRYGRPA